MRPRPLMKMSVLAVLILGTGLAARGDLVVDFEDIPLAPGSFDNGDPGGLAPGDEVLNTFVSRGAAFNNLFGIDDTDPRFPYPYWNGWAISSVEDATTPGFGNQYASYAGGGSGGGGNYAVAFLSGAIAPVINLPDLAFTPEGLSVRITNTTYSGLSMLNGDSFSFPLGGIPGGGGSVPDFVRLTITGYAGADANGGAIGSVDFYLADYRFDDNALDYIVQDWAEVDLSGLRDAGSLGFSIALSPALIDPVFGPTVPLYFALDDLTYVGAVVPEPSSLALLALGLLGGGLAVRRRRRSS